MKYNKEMLSVFFLLTTIISISAGAVCWVDSNPVRVQSIPVASNIVQYEWKIKGSRGTDTRFTNTNIFSTSDYGLPDNPIQVSVIQTDEFGNRSPESPRSDFIFAYPPFGTDLNGDGKVNFTDDYMGKPYLTGMTSTFGCKSCALVGQCPPETTTPISAAGFTPMLLAD